MSAHDPGVAEWMGMDPVAEKRVLQRAEERKRIALTAELSGSPWLAYMAVHGEPAMVPDAWDAAVCDADWVLRQARCPCGWSRPCRPGDCGMESR